MLEVYTIYGITILIVSLVIMTIIGSMGYLIKCLVKPDSCKVEEKQQCNGNCKCK
jgi:hypothetical protein